MLNFNFDLTVQSVIGIILMLGAVFFAFFTDTAAKLFSRISNDTEKLCSVLKFTAIPLAALGAVLIIL